MNVTKLDQLLYLKTCTSNKIATECKYLEHTEIIPKSMKQVLYHYLEFYGRYLPLQIKVAKRLLHINKLVPIYVNQQTILFPIRPQRSPIQCYINAKHIVAMHAINNHIIIVFEQQIQLIIDAPYTLNYNKWKESLLLSHLIPLNYAID
ncbi:competence protein ComK [Staphylococcus lugdunensis]|uniref:competence protein ComK n=1 Tax=Staphylococcus lugdunensis TaxID=28035 RepID=UPI0001C5486C|nr:competence protein ComK [Staphylococcus lugdunensis]ADC87248.1 Hypothetical protein SLGD_01157 [Staphylococcus lugdunensis HKU09-01]MCH8638706.1 competence protein ComK [Staphylococcus lugdunensis]